MASHPGLSAVAPAVLYRTLGATLPDGAAAAATIWPAAQRAASTNPAAVRRAGIGGEDPELGDRLFDAVLQSASGLIVAVPDPADRPPPGSERRVELAIPEMLADLEGLATESPPAVDDEFPLVLAAGERRSFTANALIRDPSWRKKEADGALRISPDDASRLGLTDGSRASLTTKRASVEVEIEISDILQPGHISLPNGYGLAYPGDGGKVSPGGISVNELTSVEDRDWLAGTPWHKYVPARLEPLAPAG